ncbi:MAG: glycosyltransferase [Thiolinea sp.]
MSSLFIATNRNPKQFWSDPSFVYRCGNLGCSLQKQRQYFDFLHITRLSWFDIPKLTNFHRPRQNPRFHILLHWLKLRGSKITTDFDDLIFDPEYAKYSPGVLNQSLSFEKTLRNYKSHYKALAKIDLVTVSTEPLREHVLRLWPDKQVLVLPNAVHYSWRKQFDHEPVPSIDWQRPIITYLPGTRSHDRDFAVFADGLARFLHDHPQVQLQITGPLNIKLPVPVRPEQLIHRDKVPFAEYRKHIQTAWVNLAPLEDTPFTRCKSALKVIEAGYWGKPTLCSPNPDAERFVGSGAIMIEDNDQLYAELKKLLDPDYYQVQVQGLRERVLHLSDVDQFAQRFLEWVGVESNDKTTA